MILATHVVIAAAAAKPFSNPILAFIAALASHYLSDLIPHWDYELKSLPNNENADKKSWMLGSTNFRTDFIKFSADGLIGALIAFLLLRPASYESLYYYLAIVVGGTLPDFLQGLYFTGKAEFLKPHQKFHDLIHTKIKLGPYPLIGIPAQALIFLMALWII